ncbi:hypothetical protein NE237_029768 [Protea cynaroides]|uniref:Chromo domain-containing protein n=1 Tax=Protea cynaroides TaxID=273540 RepID=A0A9Q0JV42_9MAGN|nr:hypothetical protein NE237_029768 [Protea cynaroides]
MKGGRKKSELLQARLTEKDGENSGAAGVFTVGVGAEGAVGSKEEAPPLVTEEMEEEEEEEEEEGQDVGVGGDGVEVVAEGERPKLDEGFYEIEDVRRKRVRKGQVQYLIKWRGWPETANTWEPYENLQSCYDVIEAFEESLRTGKNSSSRSSRKRKHKSGASLSSLSQPKRKQRSAPNSSGVKVKETIELLTFPTPDNPSLANRLPDRIEAGNTTEGKICGDVNNEKTTEQPIDNESVNVSLDPELNRQTNGVDPKLSELKGIASDEVNNGKFTIHIPDGRATEDGLSKAEGVEPDQSSCFTGAKRRKSGSVKRFNKDSVSSEPGRVQNSNAIRGESSSGRIEPQRMEEAGTMGDNAGEKTRMDHSTNSSCITKIIKVVSYSASISNNVQDASVKFLVMRSDGKEMVVDNKFLTVNNPLLLISYYEQLLRYSPR